MICRPGRLLVVGSVIGDVLMRVPHLPSREGDVLATSSVAVVGGGYNVLYAARRLGMPAALAGRVGAGPIADLVYRRLNLEGIDVLLPRVAGEQGLSTGFVEPAGEVTFVTAPGTESLLSREELDAVEVREDDAVYLSGYDLLYPVAGPAIASWLVESLPESALVFFDPGPLFPDIPDDVMDKVTQRLDVIGLNQRELQLFTGSPVVELTEEHRREMYATMRPGVVVLARQGARGCRLGSLEGGRVDLPAYTEVDVVNTTGAGDTHTGVFLAELWRGAGLEEAAAVATVAASLSVARDASAGGPSREELDAALARMGRTSEGSAG